LAASKWTVTESNVNGRYRPPTDAALALADGRVFRGLSFGAPVEGLGEIVFTTTMVGYQEVCTDPSFRGQIVCMTYPLIGNYGVDDESDESRQPWISGLVVRELCDWPSHYRSSGTFDDYLRQRGVPGIMGVDTRALTRHIRTVGDTRAILVPNAASQSDVEIVARAKHAPLPAEQDVVGDVRNSRIEILGVDGSPHIVLIDCGVKRNIIRSLLRRGAKVSVVPFGTSADEMSNLDPDGVIVSPGPGDPANLDEGFAIVGSLIATGTPYLGICLGHQLLARSLGAQTRKLKFGHRGGNHPVRDERTGRVTITSQNHGFEVDGRSLPRGEGWEVTLVNLNDDSVEGLRHATRPVMSVQFHPEASPGPWDNDDLFDQFLSLVAEHQGEAGRVSRSPSLRPGAALSQPARSGTP